MWEGQNIIVSAHGVRITPPYDSAHCAGADANALSHARKVLEGIRAKRAAGAPA